MGCKAFNSNSVFLLNTVTVRRCFKTRQSYLYNKCSKWVPLVPPNSSRSSSFMQTAYKPTVVSHFVCCTTTTKHRTDVFEPAWELKAKKLFKKGRKKKKAFRSPVPNGAYFTAYPRRAFAYSWRKPLGTVSSMTVGYEGFREALGCGSEPVWRGAEPMKSPQRIRHPQLHVALMRRVRDFLTTPLPKRSGFFSPPVPLFLSPSPFSWSLIFYINSRVMLSPVQRATSIYVDLSDANWNWIGLIVMIQTTFPFPMMWYEKTFSCGRIAGVLLSPRIHFLSKTIQRPIQNQMQILQDR